MYSDVKNEDHLIFFSGGNAAKGSCGDLFLHNFIISNIFTGKSSHEKGKQVYQKNLVLNAPSYPLSGYAAIIVTFNQIPFYVIHGGISCNYSKVYSNLFAIDILDRKYILIPQNDTFA
jgi:hypothetical protein